MVSYTQYDHQFRAKRKIGVRQAGIGKHLLDLQLDEVLNLLKVGSLLP